MPPTHEGQNRATIFRDTDGAADSGGAVCENRLLASLSPGALARVTPHLERVHLENREIVFRPHEPLQYVYFPLRSVISLVTHLQSGETLEVGLVGSDGLAGIAVFPGIRSMSCEGMVQIPGWAYRMSADALRRELLVDQGLYSTIARYAQVLLVRSMQMSACNMFHSVEKRCIRWLLTVNDLTRDDDLPLTHELIATMLGVHRPTVTTVLGLLQRSALIDVQHGRIRLRNRPGLEAACCECYGIMRAEQARVLGY